MYIKSKIFLLIGILCCIPRWGFSQTATEISLQKSILQKDSLLFEIGFNKRNIIPFEDLISHDCEFYHDQSGVTVGKIDFISDLKNGLFTLEYVATRKVVPGSIKIFPLPNNGSLYGALQQGKHEFYATHPGKKPIKTSVAFFTHLWLMQDDNWQLSRVISYDHQAAK